MKQKRITLQRMRTRSVVTVWALLALTLAACQPNPNPSNHSADPTPPPGAPVIFFTDLASAPNTGGQDDLGAFVTVWGANLGGERGSGRVTVGGGEVARYMEWTDRMITFQLGPAARSGNLVVTTAMGASNALPFTVRPGNIYFVTPHGAGDGSYTSPFSPDDYVARLAAGEDGAIAYFRAGVYDGQYAHQGWHANFCLTSEHSGKPGYENAFVAYPGETAEVRTSDTTGADWQNFRLHSDPAKYIVVSRFHLYAQRGSVGAHTGWRVVGNVIDAIHEPSATGAIGTGLYQDDAQRGIAIYGNEIKGGSSGNKLDHAIYPGSGVDDLDIGWNYIHDNNFASGPMISLNCNEAWTKGLSSTGVVIHDNIIDVAQFPSRAVGVFETGPGSAVEVHDNLIIGSAPSGNPTLYAMSGNVTYHHNTVYLGGSNNQGAVLSFYSGTASGHTYAPESIAIQRNIVYAGDASAYYIKVRGSAPEPAVAANLFYGIQNPPGDDRYLRDDARVVADPQFVEEHPSAYDDFRLKPSSPVYGEGIGVRY